MNGVSVAEAKRRFSELVARAAYSRERFIIERRGKPLAALVGLEDLTRLEAQTPAARSGRQGLLAAAGALGAYRGFERVMADVYRARQASRGRRVPLA